MKLYQNDPSWKSAKQQFLNPTGDSSDLKLINRIDAAYRMFAIESSCEGLDDE